MSNIGVLRGGYVEILFLTGTGQHICLPSRSTPNVSMETVADTPMWRIVHAIANEIEGETASSESWMVTEGICEFGGLTAAELIASGEGILVVEFLLGVLVGIRD